MWLVRQLLVSLSVIWLAVTLIYFMLRVLPGDAISAQLAQGGVSQAVIDQRRADEGLSDPVPVQYIRYLAGLLRGDLGRSLLTYEPVAQIIVRTIPPTLELAVGSSALAGLLGLLLGVLGAARVGCGISTLAQVVRSLSLSVPVYYTGTIAIYAVTMQRAALPSLGEAGWLDNLALPVFVLGFALAGGIARVTESGLRGVLDAEFIRTARAKGLPERQVLARHALRAAILPVIRVISLQAGFLLGGAVITEQLFVRPGLGKLLLDSAVQQDYPVVQGLAILAAAVYTTLNALTDMASHILDPRVRQSI